MSLDVVQLLEGLVQIPSVNPMGRAVSGDIYYEHRVTAHLESLFRGLGLPVERHTVAPLRDNIITRVEGDVPPDRGGKILMLEAHQDTVPVDGMTIEPFAARIDGGRLYGRGACDIKGGMAAMIAALARLAKERPAGRPTVVMACTINEEHGFTGATHWATTYSGKPPGSGRGPEPPPAATGRSQLLPRVPDAAIVAEPTKLNVVVAHKGAARWRLVTRGVATHSSQPHLGDNAIYHMARVLNVLERYSREVPGLGQHPLCGHPTLSVGLISGGISVNTVPDRCMIEIDRRVLPGEDPQAALDHCIAHLARHVEPPARFEHEPPFMLTSGLSDAANGELAERLIAAIRRVSGGGERIGVPFGTDAPHFAATGCPTVVFGPGSIDQAHTADEWLDLDQLRAAAEILFDLASAT